MIIWKRPSFSTVYVVYGCLLRDVDERNSWSLFEKPNYISTQPKTGKYVKDREIVKCLVSTYLRIYKGKKSSHVTSKKKRHWASGKIPKKKCVHLLMLPISLQHNKYLLPFSFKNTLSKWWLYITLFLCLGQIRIYYRLMMAIT